MFGRKRKKQATLVQEFIELTRENERLKSRNKHFVEDFLKQQRGFENTQYQYGAKIRAAEAKHEKDKQRLLTWYKQRLARQLELLKGVSNDQENEKK